MLVKKLLMALVNLKNYNELAKTPDNMEKMNNWLIPANSPQFNWKTYLNFEYLEHAVPRKYWNSKSVYHNYYDLAFAQKLYPRYFEETQCT